MAQAINYYHLWVLLVIFVWTYVLIIKKSFDKHMAGLLGSLAALVVGSAIGVFDQKTFLSEDIASDYLILAILLGNLLIVAVASEIGIFQFISIKLLKATKGDPEKLYWALGGLTFIFSAFVSTIPAILIVGALTIVACNELQYNPKNYILMEIVITNTGGITTSISAITNLIIAIPFKISFVRFLIIALPLSIILFFVSMLMMKRICPIPETDDAEWRITKINEFDEWSFVKNKNKFMITSFVFVLTLVLLLFSDILHMEIAVIFVGGGIIMLYTSGKDIEKVMAKLDWPLLAFFMSLFVLIKSLEIVGLMELLSDWIINILGTNPYIGAIIILVFSSLLSGILDNVVLAISLTPVLLDIAAKNPNLNIGLLVWALIIGTNLGGGLTPIGAPPCVLGLGILYRETGIKIGWGEFFKSVGKVTIVRIVISALYLIILGLLFSSSTLVGI